MTDRLDETRLFETYRGFVYPGDCDIMGHLPTFKYFEMFDAAAYHFLAHLGIRFDGGMATGMADVHQEIDYLSEIRAGALLLIRSGILKVGSSSIRSVHLMTDLEGSCEHARLETVSVSFDLQARKAIPLPTDLRARAEALIGAGMNG